LAPDRTKYGYLLLWPPAPVSHGTGLVDEGGEAGRDFVGSGGSPFEGHYRFANPEVNTPRVFN
jgi:hypothetical protein